MSLDKHSTGLHLRVYSDKNVHSNFRITTFSLQASLYTAAFVC